MNALKTLEKINAIAKENAKNDVVREVCVSTKCFRQGDLYIFKVTDDWEVGDKLNRSQIADGTSLGSRHVLKGKHSVYNGVKMPACIDNDHSVGMGYAFDVEPGAVLEHPEHDNYLFKDGGRYQVQHQLDMRTKQRALD